MQKRDENNLNNIESDVSLNGKVNSWRRRTPVNVVEVSFLEG